MTTEPLDPRRHAYRADLADERLRGRVAAGRFVQGQRRQVVQGCVPMRGRPDARDSLTTQVLFGATLAVFDAQDGWAWAQLESDGYVGYVPAEALSPAVHKATHCVNALGTFLYPEADIKAPPLLHLPMTADLAVVETGPSFARLHEGTFVPAQHIARLHLPARDYVDVAERFLGAPYLWGGKTGLGVDCSGLVQVSLQACGMRAPRDSDMQENELGTPVAIPAHLDGLQRGDLVFWKGHVGMLVDPETLLHANAHHMSVVAEPLQGAMERIGSAISSIRRIRDAGV